MTSLASANTIRSRTIGQKDAIDLMVQNGFSGLYEVHSFCLAKCDLHKILMNFRQVLDQDTDSHDEHK